jgi:hypothetical protein
VSAYRIETSTTLANDSLITVAEGQVSSELAGEVVILDLKAGIYYGLDPVGARVWELLQQPKRVCDLAEAIVAEYEVDRMQCEHDLRILLEDLAGKGLINICNEASG